MPQSWNAGSLVVALSLALGGCDAWPTMVVNRSSDAVTFRWRHKDHAEWSAPWTVAPGQSAALARAHYVEDFTGVEVEAQGRTYPPTAQQLSSFRRTCARSALDRMTTLGDCEITYSGGGRFAVRRVR